MFLENISTVIASITCLVGWLDCIVEGILQDSTDVQAVAVCWGLLVMTDLLLSGGGSE